jgi:hypothetical protein
MTVQRRPQHDDSPSAGVLDRTRTSIRFCQAESTRRAMTLAASGGVYGLEANS